MAQDNLLYPCASKECVPMYSLCVYEDFWVCYSVPCYYHGKDDQIWVLELWVWGIQVYLLIWNLVAPRQRERLDSFLVSTKGVTMPLALVGHCERQKQMQCVEDPRCSATVICLCWSFLSHRLSNKAVICQSYVRWGQGSKEKWSQESGKTEWKRSKLKEERFSKSTKNNINAFSESLSE